MYVRLSCLGMGDVLERYEGYSTMTYLMVVTASSTSKAAFMREDLPAPD